MRWRTSYMILLSGRYSICKGGSVKYIFSAWGLKLKINIYDCIRLAAEYNFDGIMYGIKDIKDVSLVKKHLEHYQILPAIYYHRFVLCEDYKLLAKQLYNLEVYASYAALLGSKAFLISIVPGSDILCFEENYGFHIKSLSIMADILKNYDIKLCLEFMGAAKISYRYNFIKSAQELLNLIQEISKDNIKIVLDTYHLYHSRELTNFDFEKFSPYIDIVHLNDVADEISGGDVDRRLPNMIGNIDSNLFLSELRKINYQGYVMVELCNRSLCTFSMEEIFCKVRKSLECIYVDGDKRK